MAPTSSNGGVAGPGVTTETVPGADTHAGRRCCDVHCNTLWSVWYGILVIALQVRLLRARLHYVTKPCDIRRMTV